MYYVEKVIIRGQTCSHVALKVDDGAAFHHVVVTEVASLVRQNQVIVHVAETHAKNNISTLPPITDVSPTCLSDHLE